MQRLFRLHGDCWNCSNPILQGHVDSKFCSNKCSEKFDNDLNNATTSLKKKIRPLVEQHYGERVTPVLEALVKNDKALRKVIRSLDFGFQPVERLVLEKHGFDFYKYTSTEVNPRTDGRIYWTYAMGVEVGPDPETVTIRFRKSDGSPRTVPRPRT